MGFEWLPVWTADPIGQGWLTGVKDETEPVENTGDLEADRDARNDAADAAAEDDEKKGNRRRRNEPKDFFDAEQKRRFEAAVADGNRKAVREIMDEAGVPRQTQTAVIREIRKGNTTLTAAQVEEVAAVELGDTVSLNTGGGGTSELQLHNGSAVYTVAGTKKSKFGNGDNGVIITGDSIFTVGKKPKKPATPGSPASFRQGEEQFDVDAGSGETAVPTEFFESLPQREQKWLPTIVAAASRYGIDSGLLYGLLKQESNFDPDVISGTRKSSAGAIGIAQFMPSTARSYGIDPTDPEQSIFAAAEYLSKYIKHGPQAALVAYNAGPGRMQEFLRSGSLPSETAAYIPAVLGYATTFNPLESKYAEPLPEPDPLSQVAIELTNKDDIDAVADDVGAQLLGRAPNDDERAYLVRAIHNLERTTQTTAAAMAAAQESGDLSTAFTSDDWQDYANGQIPTEAMTEIANGHFLRPDAASAWFRMVSAAAADGVALTITDSYRDLATQERLADEKGLYSQGGLAAEPGTSNHGWGLAVDVDQGREWLAKNGHKYGFDTIAREPWHWEYQAGGEGEGWAPFETEAPASMNAAIAAELERMNPDEVAATKLSNSVHDFMEIIGVQDVGVV